MPHRIFNSSDIARAIGVVLLTSITSVVFAIPAYAATLSIAPSSSKVTIGNIVNVKVAVSTQGKNINNSEAVIAFPADLIEVLSISKSSSVFKLWVEDPTFSNTEGKITFNGGVPNPGYVGEWGEVASITFKAKKAGNASIVFEDATVRENDGHGTDILTSKQSGVIAIESAAQLEIPAVTTSANTVPAKPLIISSTHPVQDAWYSGTSASFTWKMSDDVTSIQTLLSKSASSMPTVLYDSSVSQRTVNNLVDGVFYFHLRYQNSVGWSPVAHYKIQVDSTPPERFSIQPHEQGMHNTIVLDAYDALSGVDSYGIQIDGTTMARVKRDMLIDDIYTLPTQDGGDHTLVVTAYDKAGNHTEASAHYSSPSIVAPVVNVSSKYITKGETVVIRGTSKYSQSPVVVSVRLGSDAVLEYPVITAEDGTFSVTTTEFKSSGSAIAWAQLIFSDMVKSPLSDKVFFEVNDTPLVRTTKTIAYALSLIILIIILLLILVYVSYLGWHKFFGLRRRIGREVDTTVDDIHKAMMLFREELGKQLDILERTKDDRALNKKEEKIFKELQNNIDRVDDFIEKKLKKIR